MESLEERKEHRYKFSVGKPPIYTPEELEAAIHDYVESVQDYLLREEVLQKVKIGKDDVIKRMHVNKARIMHVVGCCNHLKINTSTWYDYAKKERYSEITTRANELFKMQRSELAAAGLIDSAYIARLDGLTDKSEREVKFSDVTDYSKIPEEEIQARAQAIKERKAKENERKENNS